MGIFAAIFSVLVVAGCSAQPATVSRRGGVVAETPGGSAPVDPGAGAPAGTDPAAGIQPAAGPAGADPVVPGATPPAPGPGPAPGPAGSGGGDDSSDFQQAGAPTAINGAYLTAYRDPINNANIDRPTVKVYVVVRDKAGKALPKPLAFTEATASFDDATATPGEAIDDPGTEHQICFTIPKDQLTNLSLGRDRLRGAIRLKSPVIAEPQLETSIVIWLANVALVAERSDYGTIVIPPDGQPKGIVKVSVVTSSHEQPAQRSLLQGLGGDLVVDGGSCPTLSETEPADITDDCEIALAPTQVTRLDRVLTLSYYNGIRMDFASIVIRGEAVVILGQEDGETFGASGHAMRGLKRPYDMTYAGGKLLVVDQGHDRVVAYDGIPRRSFAEPVVTLGHSNPPPITDPNTHYYVYQASPSSLYQPTSVASDGHSIVVGDSRNLRIMIWKDFPTADNANADYVLGPNNFLETHGNLTSAVFFTQGLLWDGTHLVASFGADGGGFDYEDGEPALFWDGIPQATATPHAGTYGAVPLLPGRISFDGTRYYEALRDRVKIFNHWPIDYLAPDVVVGATTPQTLYDTFTCECKAASDGTVLAATRSSSVYVWNNVPTVSDTPPDFVLGQADTSTQTPNFFGASPDSLSGVTGILIADDKLFIADSDNNRVIIRPVPKPKVELAGPEATTNYNPGESAPGIVHFTERNVQLGNLDHSIAATRELALIYSGNTPVTVMDTSFSKDGVAFTGGAFPGTGGTCGTTIEASCTVKIDVLRAAQGALSSTLSISYENGKETAESSITVLASLRSYARRILMKNENTKFYPEFIAPGGAGKLVVTQGPVDCTVDLYASADMTAKLFSIGTGTDNACAYDEGDEDESYGLSGFVLNSRLYVHNGLTYKTSVWTTVPTSAATPSDFVYGTGFYTTGRLLFGKEYEPFGDKIRVYDALATDGIARTPAFTISAGALPGSRDVASVHAIGGRFVAVLAPDNAGKIKLLAWSTPPGASGPAPAASFEYQLLFDRDYYDAYSYAFVTDGTRLILGDLARNRVVIWDSFPETGQAPDHVLGQLDASGKAPNDGGIGLWSFHAPEVLFIQDGELYVKDLFNSRYLVYDLGHL